VGSRSQLTTETERYLHRLLLRNDSLNEIEVHMKAAVLHAFGQSPRYEDFADPQATEGEVLVRVKAASLKNVDKLRF
jgi:hypothetical protein